tara:strand:- start:1373 stop:1636 length:264 start_codon:yes stop_codon:yes gene_type:complete
MGSTIGNINELRHARTIIPVLFQSYRFLDHLISNVKNIEVKYYLDDLRKKCLTPTWISYEPLLQSIDAPSIDWESDTDDCRAQTGLF